MSRIDDIELSVRFRYFIIAGLRVEAIPDEIAKFYLEDKQKTYPKTEIHELRLL